MGLTVFEAALTLFLAWLLLGSGFARHASSTLRAGAADLFILAALGACLAFFLFVLVYWQWRLRARARLRLVLAIYVSLLWAFCSFAWFDVIRAQEERGLQPLPSAYERVIEQTVAVSMTMGALVLGLVAVAVLLWLDRRFLNRDKGSGIVGG